MPQQFTLHQQQPPAYATETYLHNDNNNNSSNTYMTPRQTSFSNNNYSQYQNNTQSQTQIQQPNTNNSLPDFQRFYGPVCIDICFDLTVKNNEMYSYICNKQKQRKNYLERHSFFLTRKTKRTELLSYFSSVVK